MESELAKVKKIRVACEISPQLAERLDAIANDSHLTLTDVMRRAFALVDVAYEAKSRGERLGILDADRKLLTEITNVF